jgi:AAA domain
MNRVASEWNTPPTDTEGEPARNSKPELRLPPLTVRAPGEVLALEFDESDNLLGDRLLAKGQSMTILGAGGIGKSRLLLQLAVCMITGKPWLGLETRGTGLSWLILQGENSTRRLQSDLAKLKEWCGEEWAFVEGTLRIHTLETESDGFLSLDMPENYSRIEAAIAANSPDVVAFDCLNNFAIGDPNKDGEMRATCVAMSRLAKTGNPDRALVTLHHALTGKAGAAKATGWERSGFGRNSKVLHAWTRGQVNVSPGTADSSEVMVLSCGKCSNGKEFAPFAVRLNPATMIYEVAPDFDFRTWEREISGKAEGPLVTNEVIVQQATPGRTRSELAKALMAETRCGRTLAYRRIEEALKAKLLLLDKLNGKLFPK